MCKAHFTCSWSTASIYRAIDFVCDCCWSPSFCRAFCFVCFFLPSNQRLHFAYFHVFFCSFHSSKTRYAHRYSANFWITTERMVQRISTILFILIAICSNDCGAIQKLDTISICKCHRRMTKEFRQKIWLLIKCDWNAIVSSNNWCKCAIFILHTKLEGNNWMWMCQSPCEETKKRHGQETKNVNKSTSFDCKKKKRTGKQLRLPIVIVIESNDSENSRTTPQWRGFSNVRPKCR